jgi:hypothetical protein
MEKTLKTHLYEFKFDKKKLKCLCGWERTLRNADIPSMQKLFEEHRAQAALLPQK